MVNPEPTELDAWSRLLLDDPVEGTDSSDERAFALEIYRFRQDRFTKDDDLFVASASNVNVFLSTYLSKIAQSNGKGTLLLCTPSEAVTTTLRHLAYVTVSVEGDRAKALKVEPTSRRGGSINLKDVL